MKPKIAGCGLIATGLLSTPDEYARYSARCFYARNSARCFLRAEQRAVFLRAEQRAMDDMKTSWHLAPMSYDWTAIVEKNRPALMRLAVLLAAMIVPRMKRYSYRAALARLRPLESAVRRLIVIAAQGVVVKPDGRTMPKQGMTGKVSARRHTSFPLFDLRRQIRPNPVKVAPPMIRFLDEPFMPAKPRMRDTDIVDAGVLVRRVERMQRALGQLDVEARRLARWQLRKGYASRRPMRPGRPPGYSDRKRKDEEQNLLKELQGLALIALAPDTG